MNRNLSFWCGILLIWASWVGEASADLVLGVHPFKPPSQLVKAFSPLVEHLTKVLGEPVTVQIAKDYQTHIDSIGQDKVDIAYLGPVPFVIMRDTYGAKPLLARQQIGKSSTFHGTIFVRSESPIQSLAELRGKRFAFGERRSTMSHLVPRYMLWQAGVTADQFASHTFVGDHVNVALGVLAGDYDAGAVKEDVFLKYQSRGLRALARSAPFSDHVFVASGKMPAKKVKMLRDAMLDLHSQPGGPAILESLTHGITALIPVQDSNYDSLGEVLRKLRELGVDS